VLLDAHKDSDWYRSLQGRVWPEFRVWLEIAMPSNCNMILLLSLMSFMTKCQGLDPREVFMDVNKAPFPVINVIAEDASPAMLRDLGELRRERASGRGRLESMQQEIGMQNDVESQAVRASVRNLRRLEHLSD